VNKDEGLTDNDDSDAEQIAPNGPLPDPEVPNAPETAPSRDDGGAPRLRLSWGGATHPGEIRPINQDALFADRGLFVVADGMGGHQAGEVASRISVKTLAGRDHSTVDELVAGVTAANDAVWEHASSGPEFKGMGTTLTALAVIGDGRPPRLGLVNVGDSRAYRLRGGDFVQLTEDHSYVAELVRRGQITESDAETHPYRNMVTRAIGVAVTIDVDRWEMSPEAGDVFLLCSDGLVNELADPRILELLVGHDDPTESAKELISAANAAGGRDNITVVIVRVDAEDPAPVEASDERHSTSPLDTGVIAPVLSGSATKETAEMVGLPEQLEETTAALAALDEIEAGLTTPGDSDEIEDEPPPEDEGVEPPAEESVDPPSRPADPLDAFDLPVLEGDEASLPWLTEAAPDTATTNASDRTTDPSPPESPPATAPLAPDPPAVSPPPEPPPVKETQTPSPPTQPGPGASVPAESSPAGHAPTGSPSSEPQDRHQREDSVGSATQASTSARPDSDPTTPMAQFTGPVNPTSPVDHLDPAVTGWRAPVAVTWRSLLFIAVALAVIIGAGALLGWYARSAYYVGFSGDEVVVYQGRPDGVLWFDPTLEEGTGIFRQDLSDSINVQIEDLYETGTLAGARAFVEEIRPGPRGPDAAPTGDAVGTTTTTRP